MDSELIYGIGGLAVGGLAVYLLIQKGIIPNPAPVVARAPAAARTPLRAAVRPVATNVAPAQYGGKFTSRGNGRQFGGAVTARNIPTQYARAGILASAQEFGQHQDLIRID